MMKSFSVGIMLLVASPAFAERYVFTAIDGSKGRAMALDLSSLRTVAGQRRVWLLTMFAKEAKPFFSQSLEEFDCVQERAHTIAGKFYRSDHTESGDVDPTNWTYPTPNTPQFDNMQVSCGVKATKADEEINRPAPDMFDKFVEFAKSQK